MSTTTAVTTVDTRVSFSFSASGSRASSIAITAGEPVLELWDGPSGRPRPVPDCAVTPDTGMLPCDDGTVLLWRRHGTSRRHEVARLTEHGVESWGWVPAYGGYLLAAPTEDWAPGLAVVATGARQSTLWRLSADAPHVEPLLDLPGVLSGGAWIDPAVGVLALNQTLPGDRPHGIVVDLRDGSWRRIWSVSDRSTDRIVLCAPETRLMVVSSNVTGESRIGWGVLGERAVHFPESLHRSGFPMHALAVDGSGTRVLLHRTEGAVSRLYCHEPFDDRLTPLAAPRGTVRAPARWVGAKVRVPLSTPDGPATVHTLVPGVSSTSATDRASADLVRVAGAAGAIEAVRYGGARWRHSAHLVIALHGGPLAASRFEYDPLLHRLATAGVAVLAPNYRGSTGYGEPHLRAALGRWGGPDLSDVLAIGTALAAERRRHGLPPPVLLGASYGGYLALLAASTEPEAWSGCVALAPFLSAEGLWAAAGDAVRDRLGEVGLRDSPDVLDRCAALTAPLLLVHGDRDERIPVEQSRTLHRALRAREFAVEYRELRTDHGGVVDHPEPMLLDRIEDFCLTRTVATRAGGGRKPQLTAEGGEHDGVRGL